MSKLDEIHPTFREALAVQEIWRRMGFAAGEIFFGFDAKRTAVSMVLRRGKHTFTVACGNFLASHDGARTLWSQVARAWNGGLTDDERRTIYRDSYARRNIEVLIYAMGRKGFHVKSPR